MPEPIVLTSDYAKINAARAVPGAYWDGEAKAYVLSNPTPRAAAVALKLFPALAVEHPWLADERDKLAQDVRPFDRATEYGTGVWAPTVMESLIRDELSFYDFQTTDLGYVVDVLKTHGGAYIGWERGLGKTLAAAAVIDSLETQRVLVVAPNTAKMSVWKPELDRWLDGSWSIEVLPNIKRKRERMIEAVKRRDMGLILVVHYEALRLIDWKKIGEWDLIVADEVHRISNPKSQQTRALKKIKGKRKLALSGSIIQNHADELFSPLQWLFPENYRSKWRDWNDRYLDFVDSGYGRICIGIKHERLDAMRDELSRFMVYRRKEDELDLPPRTDQDVYVDLTPTQRKAYDELKITCLTELEDGTRVKAMQGLVMLTKLRQLASGLDLVGNVSDSSKLDLTLDMVLDNHDEAFVIWTWYKAAGVAMQERLEAKGVETFRVDGEVKHEDRAGQIEEFQSGSRRVFIGTIASLGESVTLHRASNAIFLDRSWNPGANDQAADRIYRIGQSKPVTILNIIARDTVDELNVLPQITNKAALRRLILGG